MSSTRTPRPEPAATPVLEVTRYDRVSAWLVAIVVGLAAACFWLTTVWATNRLPSVEGPVPVELLEIEGGVDDGALEETLRLDAPEPETADAALADTEEESEIKESLENVVELSDQAVNQARQQFELDVQNAGQRGSASGTGRRALGIGPGQGSVPREKRWFIRFADQSRLDVYAKQLDYFGIEMGVLLPEGKLIYVSRFSQDRPVRRTAASGKGEQRLYMTWQGGQRKLADLQLLEKAGVEADSDSMVLHFYPPKTEQLLATLEREYRQRPVEQIRRTYFTVLSERRGFRFAVTRQIYFR